jgi:hypothetical protein
MKVGLSELTLEYDVVGIIIFRNMVNVMHSPVVAKQIYAMRYFWRNSLRNG